MLTTILIIAEQALLHIPLLLGSYISISLMKVPDLSIESAYVFGALFGAKALLISNSLPYGLDLLLPIIASLAGGALVGIISSLLTQRAGLPHLLSSILTIGVFHGIYQLLSDSYVSLGNLNNPLATINLFSTNPELPILLLICTIVGGAVYLLLKTQLGYAYAIYGNNPRFFHHYGIESGYVFMTGIIISNALAGLAGYLFAQSNGFFEITMGFGKPLLCITALILGKVIMKKIQLIAISIPLLGCAAYFTLQQLLLKVGFNLKYFTAVQALIIVLILIITRKKNHIHIDHLGV